MYMEAETLTWVERRKKIESNLFADLDYIWRDVKQALEDATKSFNSEYSGDAEAVAVNGHRFRIRCTSSPTPTSHRPTEIDIAFDKEKRELQADSPDLLMRHLPKRFHICADVSSAFICDDKDQRITPDQVSQLVLEPVFFPTKSHHGWQNFRIS